MQILFKEGAQVTGKSVISVSRVILKEGCGCSQDPVTPRLTQHPWKVCIKENTCLAPILMPQPDANGPVFLSPVWTFL